MTLRIDNYEIEKLLEQIVAMTGESETEVIRNALEERRQQLVQDKFDAGGGGDLFTFLQMEIWPQIPPELSGTKLTKAEEEEILGFDEEFP